MKALKRMLVILMAFLLTLSCSALAAIEWTEGENLIANPSFELDGLGSDGWFTVTQSGAPGWSAPWTKLLAESDDLYQAQDGGKFIKMPIGQDYGAGGIAQLVTGLEGGKAYRVGMWHYGSAGVNAKLYVYFCKTYEFNGETVTTTLEEWATNTGNTVTGTVKHVPFYSPKVIDGVSYWQKVSYAFVLNPLADAVRVQIIDNLSPGTVCLIDNVSLRETDNIIPNPDFEQRDYNTSYVEAGAAANWRTGTKETWYSNDSHSGNWAFTPPGANIIKASISTSSIVNLDINPDQKYRFSYWYKVRSGEVAVASNVLVAVTCEGATKPYVLYMKTPAVSPEDGWVQYVGYFTTPSTAQTILVQITGAETAAYDDVALVAVEDEREMVGFTSVEPALSKPTSSTSSTYDRYPDELLSEAYGYTFCYAESLTPSTTVYASAFSPADANAVLVIGMYSTIGNAKILREVKVARPGESGSLLSESITVPDAGYTMEAFLWDGFNAAVPLSSKIEMQ